MAVIAGLEALNRPCEVELYSDSQYVVNAFNQHWIDGWVKKGWNAKLVLYTHNPRTPEVETGGAEAQIVFCYVRSSRTV